VPIVCLITDPASPVLDSATVDHVRAALPSAGEATWLADGEAAEFAVPEEAGSGDAIEARARQSLGEMRVDVAVVPDEGRRKQLLVADMDSTIIGQECIDELADHVGLRDGVAAITERAMLGELPFEDALRERVALLRGLEIAVVDETLAERIQLTSGAKTLVRTMRANGARAALVSGGFTAFTAAIAADVGFDEHRANQLIVEDSRVVGVAEPIRGKEAKLEALRDLATRHGLPLAAALAVGDGANDLAIVEAAGLGVAYHAKPALRAKADARIDHGDLTALLYLQGYRKEEFSR